jgi:hypothetical protein
LIVDGAAEKRVIIGGGSTGDSVTVTEDSAYVFVFATLVARTEYVPAVPGAVYTPSEVISPPVAVQVTEVLLAPVTVAVKRCVPPVVSATVAGSRLTVTPGGFTITGGSPPPSQPSKSRGSVSTRELRIRHIVGLQPEGDAREGRRAGDTFVCHPAPTKLIRWGSK